MKEERKGPYHVGIAQVVCPLVEPSKMGGSQ